MLNFTVGPVMSYEEVLSIGANQTPYFRTKDFSDIMLENEKLILEFSEAPPASRAVFLTCSGTGAMEAVVMNLLSKRDKVLVINGGTFGQRFAELCSIHEIPFESLMIPYGKKLSEERLSQYDGKGYTALLVNCDETSTGVLYDVNMLGRFCQRNDMFFVCDCISSFLADPFHMEACGADVMITGSQKALACPPGISVVVLTERAIKRMELLPVRSMYFDLKDALQNQERGQTPFTPAVSILLQINTRLRQLKDNGGPEAEIRRIETIAHDFRDKIKGLPLKLFSESPANSVTAIRPISMNAYDIFLRLKDEYDIWVCPNGGDLKEKIFRVGHMGALTFNDNTTLIKALTDLHNRGLL